MGNESQSHRFCPFSPRKFLLIPPARDFWSYSNKIPVISNGTRKIVKITIKTENINKHSIQLNDRITGPVRKCWITLSTAMQNKKKSRTINWVLVIYFLKNEFIWYFKSISAYKVLYEIFRLAVWKTC